MDNFFQTNSIWIKAQAEIKYLSLTWTWFNILIIFLILSLYALIFILSFMFKPKSNIKSCVCISLLGSQNFNCTFFFFAIILKFYVTYYLNFVTNWCRPMSLQIFCNKERGWYHHQGCICMYIQKSIWEGVLKD